MYFFFLNKVFSHLQTLADTTQIDRNTTAMPKFETVSVTDYLFSAHLSTVHLIVKRLKHFTPVFLRSIAECRKQSSGTSALQTLLFNKVKSKPNWSGIQKENQDLAPKAQLLPCRTK